MAERCGRKTEVYSRVVGYFRPIQQWNAGKKEEFKNRRTFMVPGSKPAEEEAMKRCEDCSKELKTHSEQLEGVCDDCQEERRQKKRREDDDRQRREEDDSFGGVFGGGMPGGSDPSPSSGGDFGGFGGGDSGGGGVGGSW
jgi:uncharacterized membrane protein YgcG